MNKTNKIRAALVLAIEYAPNEYWKNQYRQLVSELDGMVLVPVEPTREMIKAAWIAQYLNIGADMVMAEKLAEIRVNDTNQKSQDCLAYEAMIAPYVNGEKK